MLAVERASWLLLNALAVLALAIAMSRLPGHASELELMTLHRTPSRSTTAAHILLGENSPPLLRLTTDDNCPSTLFTTDCDSEQDAGSLPWFCAKAPAAPVIRTATASSMPFIADHFCVFIFLPPL